jgi:hypothetical protein
MRGAAAPSSCDAIVELLSARVLLSVAVMALTADQHKRRRFVVDLMIEHLPCVSAPAVSKRTQNFKPCGI